MIKKKTPCMGKTKGQANSIFLKKQKKMVPLKHCVPKYPNTTTTKKRKHLNVIAQN
jgi:hypothetical protein